MSEGSSGGSLDAISSDSRVKLGFALSVLGGAIWWAASMQAKMDTLILASVAAEHANRLNNAAVIELEKRVLTLELKEKRL